MAHGDSLALAVFAALIGYVLYRFIELHRLLNWLRGFRDTQDYFAHCCEFCGAQLQPGEQCACPEREVHLFYRDASMSPDRVLNVLRYKVSLSKARYKSDLCQLAQYEEHFSLDQVKKASFEEQS